MPVTFSPRPVEDVIHGIAVSDPYRWLEDRLSPMTQAWIERQGTRYARYLSECDRVDALRRRVTHFLNGEEFYQPVKAGKRIFFRHRGANCEQACICETDLKTDKSQILVDPSSQGIFSSALIHQVNADGTLLAFEIATGGADAREIYFLDTVGGKVFTEHLASGRPRGIAFFSDNTGFYYSHETGNDTFTHSIRSHRFDDSLADDRTVLSMPRLGLSKLIVIADDINLGALYLHERNGEFVSDFYLTPRADETKWRLVIGRLPASSHIMLRHGRIFLFGRTDSTSKSLVELNLDGQIERVLTSEGDIPLQSVSIRDKYIYTHHFDGYESTLQLRSFFGECIRAIETPRGGTIRTCLPYGSPDDTLFYSYESFASPLALFRYDPESATSNPWNTKPTPAKFNFCNSFRTYYCAKDGAKIPITLVTKSHHPILQDRFVIMTSYGGFGVAATPKFSVLVTILLELGAVFALPHIRGGVERGSNWHEAAKGKNHQIVFDDFISAAEWLCNEGITEPKKLAIFGGSNSGLMVAAAMTQRPDLFRAVLCISALLDMLRYDRFDRASKWRQEYGSSANAEDFSALHAYSPYHHVNDTINYPSTLFVSGDQDERCNPSHTRKMAALLQERSAQRNPILLDYTVQRGHSPLLPLSVRIDALTSRIAFFCMELKIDIPRSMDHVETSL